MGLLGVLLASLGPWIFRRSSASDPQAARVVSLGVSILWIAAGYQTFDGLNLGSGFCLRGAGDATVPAGLALALSWRLFLPLAHTAVVSHLARAGHTCCRSSVSERVGGWTAMLIYVSALGSALLPRWRSKAWQRIRL